MMTPNDLFSSLHQHFGGLMPELARSAQEDLQRQARAAVLSVINKLDLVTREDFEIQTEVLRRTREKLDQLEARVAELERQLADR
ncbi:MAG: accessory factor UbiK family protein [Gammaproteobacteria bacterium]|nr:MAG: accessory factor UbiK family protein [Gammaproteobacteria bacterium]